LLCPRLIFSLPLFHITIFVRFVYSVPSYSVVLIMIILFFTFFAEATGNAVGSVVDRENVVRKVQFPRLAIPLSIVLGAMLNCGLNLIVVFIFIFANGIEPRWTWLALPVLVGALAVMATGFAT